jgi:hypothetical protein
MSPPKVSSRIQRGQSREERGWAGKPEPRLLTAGFTVRIRAPEPTFELKPGPFAAAGEPEWSQDGQGPTQLVRRLRESVAIYLDASVLRGHVDGAQIVDVARFGEGLKQRGPRRRGPLPSTYLIVAMMVASIIVAIMMAVPIIMVILVFIFVAVVTAGRLGRLDDSSAAARDGGAGHRHGCLRQRTALQA